jgi:hypothetical protein
VAASGELRQATDLTEFEFVLNLKTAKLLGATVPPFIQFGADEAIE